MPDIGRGDVGWREAGALKQECAAASVLLHRFLEVMQVAMSACSEYSGVC